MWCRGTYAANSAQGECTPCPHPLSSGRGDVICSICKEGYYLRGASAHPADIFQNPTQHCKPCPPHTDCSAGATLASLGVDAGFWRASDATSELHRCDSETCSGGSGQPSRRRRLTDGDDDPYCTAGHTGPLCEVCVADSDYFSSVEGRCIAWRMSGCEACPRRRCSKATTSLGGGAGWTTDIPVSRLWRGRG